MADEAFTTDEAALAAAARHALHDEELVAAHAAGALESEDEAATARALVERCTVCRDLHHDITAIGTALAVEARFAAAAPRDFRLSVHDALRLGGRVSRRGFVASLRRTVLAFARPVGATLATFGLVGVLVGSAAFGGAASGRLGATSNGTPTNAPAEIIAGGTDSSGPKASGDVAFGPSATRASSSADTAAPTDRDAAPTGWSPTTWLFGGSVAILLTGAVLLLVSFRRGRDGAART